MIKRLISPMKLKSIKKSQFQNITGKTLILFFSSSPILIDNVVEGYSGLILLTANLLQL